MFTLSFTITGDVEILVTVIDNGDGALTFDFEIPETNGLIGDITGIAFDLADDSIVDGLSADGEDITKDVYEADGVTKIGGGVNFNGEVVNEFGAFDAGVAIGDCGLKLMDAQSTTFTRRTRITIWPWQMLPRWISSCGCARSAKRMAAVTVR